MGSLQISCFLTDLLGTPANLLSSSKKERTFFPNLSKFITFAAAPLVLTPFVRNQSVRRTSSLECQRVASGSGTGVCEQIPYSKGNPLFHKGNRSFNKGNRLFNKEHPLLNKENAQFCQISDQTRFPRFDSQGDVLASQEQIAAPCSQAFAPQISTRTCSPPPDWVLWKSVSSHASASSSSSSSPEEWFLLADVALPTCRLAACFEVGGTTAS